MPGRTALEGNVILGLLSRAFGHGLIRLGRGGVLERLEDWLLLRIHTRQQQDALLRLAQLTVATLDEADALLVPAQRVLQAELAVLEVLDNLLQLAQGLFKCRALR